MAEDRTIPEKDTKRLNKLFSVGQPTVAADKGRHGGRLYLHKYVSLNAFIPEICNQKSKMDPILSIGLSQTEFLPAPLNGKVGEQRAQADDKHGHQAQGCAGTTSGGALHVHINTI